MLSLHHPGVTRPSADRRYSAACSLATGDMIIRSGGVAAVLAAHEHLKTEDGRRRLVRHGHGPERARDWHWSCVCAAPEIPAGRDHRHHPLGRTRSIATARCGSRRDASSQSVSHWSAAASSRAAPTFPSAMGRAFASARRWRLTEGVMVLAHVAQHYSWASRRGASSCARAPRAGVSCIACLRGRALDWSRAIGDGAHALLEGAGGDLSRTGRQLPCPTNLR